MSMAQIIEFPRQAQRMSNAYHNLTRLIDAAESEATLEFYIEALVVSHEEGELYPGEAAVYVNGEKVIQFGDRIEIIKEGQPYYSEKIGGWASVKPDADFIKGLLWHPFDDMYHYSDKVKEILDADTERMKGMDWNIEKTEGILEEIRVREGFKEFLAMAVLRFMTKDWGVVEPEDAAHNDKNPQAAIGAYMYQDEIKVYIKAEGGHLRVFLPEEC